MTTLDVDKYLELERAMWRRRLNRAHDSVMFWKTCALIMTGFCVVLALMK